MWGFECRAPGLNGRENAYQRIWYLMGRNRCVSLQALVWEGVGIEGMSFQGKTLWAFTLVKVRSCRAELMAEPKRTEQCVARESVKDCRLRDTGVTTLLNPESQECPQVPVGTLCAK